MNKTVLQNSTSANTHKVQNSGGSTNRHYEHASRIILRAIRNSGIVTVLTVITVVGSVVSGLMPPLVLERIINLLTDGADVPFVLAFLYFGVLLLTGLFDSARESLLIVLGQKITHALRRALCGKLTRLSAGTISGQDPGAVTSRFVGDVDAVEDLFTNGIISMFTDVCRIVSIFVILFIQNRGLSLLLLDVLPFVFWFTRSVQKRMLKANMENRAAVARVTNFVPETIKNIRMIHTLGREGYMRGRYGDAIEESYKAVNRTNFYDAIYSPVILLTNAVIVGAVYILAATGNPMIASFFGMSVGTSVAVINYISQVFSPIESIGMEIQTIQSAVAGVHRINEFMDLEERPEEQMTSPANTGDTAAASSISPEDAPVCIQLKDVDFSYDGKIKVLTHLNITIHSGEIVTFTGRTGAGKSTIFKLLLGLYEPQSGEVTICGRSAVSIKDSERRSIFGYVEQTYRRVPGTVRDQIALFDPAIDDKMIEKAIETAHLSKAVHALPDGLDTVCSDGIFSQGQWQLLSIARAIAAQPPILLLDEITANLDADTEKLVLSALRSASEGRTVLSISHRLYEDMGGRQIVIGEQQQYPYLNKMAYNLSGISID